MPAQRNGRPKFLIVALSVRSRAPACQTERGETEAQQCESRGLGRVGSLEPQVIEEKTLDDIRLRLVDLDAANADVRDEKQRMIGGAHSVPKDRTRLSTRLPPTTESYASTRIPLAPTR